MNLNLTVSETQIIWGVNFGENNLTAAFLEASAIADAFTSTAFQDASITLEAIEIGNESDLYTRNGVRNSSFNVQQYVTQYVYIFGASQGTQCSTCVLHIDGLHSPETSRQQPTAFSTRMFLYKVPPSVGHHIVVPPGSRPRRYSRTVSFRLLRVHKSDCASLHYRSPRQAVAVL
jgi:hypothetical protein